ncbi:MAG: hypothetical protein JW784_03830, partial [Candidatus Cloacimonetes bacterium]|nr:hypothetical protein [Candidatus Cloacimonadota bacterium]
MKRTFLLLLLLSMAFLIQAEIIQHTYYFTRPELASEDGYTEISYADCTLLGEEGEPLIPWYGASLLVPPGQEAAEVVIISQSITDELEGIVIKPASRQFPISQPVDNYQVQPDQSIYNSAAAYPAAVLRGEATHFLAGHGIVSFLVSPIRYYPAEERVELLSEITIQLTTIPTQRAQAAAAFLKDSEEISSRINSLVDNPAFSSVYTYPQQTREMEYDLLLISNTDLLPEFADYILFKESTGYSILTATIEDIYSMYPGVDNAEKVRNCIIDNYLNYNIGYVILGGDTDGQNQNNAIVPHRGFAVLDDPSLPSDMYFSNLDGSWNTDNDNSWGESNEMDLYSEVLIGRLCVDSAEEIQNFTSKLLMYQDAPVVDDIEKAAMVGEELNNSPWTWGGDYKDQIAYGSNADGYTTTGVAANFDLYFFYERDGYWDKYSIFDQFNQTGLNLLNHLGHSNPTYNMKMNNNDLTTTNFTNDGVNRGYVIGYSQGCYNGSFDNWHFSGYYTEDCFAEKFTTIATGEVATIANSRYGWYMPGGTNSSSQYYDRQFYHAIFGSNITMIGDANRASKESNASLMQNDNYMRWTAYELNLFGDPTMDIWTEMPTDMFTSYPASIPIGTDQVQLVTDAPYARVALMQGDVLIGRGMSDGTGLVSINTFAPVTDVIPIELSIIAHNKNRYLGTIYVVADQPYVIYQTHTIDDAAGNGNGLADYNECFSLDMSFNNVGNQPAADVTAVLSTDDEYVEITVDSADLGDFPAETVLNFTDVFNLQVANFIPDQHRVLFDLELTGTGGDTWTSHFFITFQAPILAIGNMYIDDSEGDGDSFLDPGETALVSIPVFNQGHALSPQAVGTLTCNNGLVSIQPVIDQITGLEPEDDFSLFFLITIDPEILVGTPIILDFDLNCTGYEGYNVNESFIQTVGLILDSFENGNFASFNWQSGGDAVWTIVDNQAYDGTYSARSGNIGSSESSHLSLELDILVSSEIRFWKMVSSEANYDFFTFSIDG